MVTTLPRNAAGDSSARYSGTTNEAAPTAAPTTARPATMADTLEQPACRAEPSTKSTSATSMTRLRPRRSASTEESGETSRAKRAVAEVMIDLSREVSCRLEREVSIEMRVADITPVSSIA